MRALVYTGSEAMEFRDAPEPAPAKDDSLVSVRHVGICGSDMHAYLGHDDRRPSPLILGHEASGVTADGRRVTVNPLVTCGTCAACAEGRENLCPDRQIISMPPREGAFAERLALPARNLVDIPGHIGTDTAALTEPLACGWHAVRIGARALHGSLENATCLVFGGGAIGFGAALALKSWGAGAVWLAEPNAKRRAIIAGAGDLNVFDPASAAGPAEPDLIIDGVGNEPTRAAACAAIRPGGVIVHIGLGSPAGGFDARRMTLQEVTFIGTYAYTMRDFRETAAAMFEGRLGPLDWAELRPLSEGARAFQDLRAHRVAAPKIILVP